MPLQILNQHALTSNEVLVNRSSLQGIQGYSLVSHGRTHVWLALLRFRAAESKLPELRSFLKEFASHATNAFDLWDGLNQYLAVRNNPRENQLDVKNKVTAALVTAIGLSVRGYALFPGAVVPRFEAFQQGFCKRFPKLPLMDLADPYDAVLVLASNDSAKQLPQAQADIESRLNGLATVQWERGQVNKTNGQTREPFGFVDGISQPALFEFEDNPHAVHWKPFMRLAQVLTREPSSTLADDEFGSLMAFMKIEQNVYAFNALVQHVAQQLGRTEDVIRSWLIGRETDGTPLMPTGNGNNDFVYESDATFAKCPAAAHIRKANPRTTTGLGVRIVRRGIPYGNGDGPRGLLFQAFASTLEQTFEFMMNHWLLDPQFPAHSPVPALDPLMGTQAMLPVPTAIAQPYISDLRSVVTIKAGEYFYFPSIRSFSRLQV
jgi:Dyp-type peroxidase family